MGVNWFWLVKEDYLCKTEGCVAL